MAKQRALIIGGSVGGLFAANLLRSTGWDAAVFERNPESSPAAAPASARIRNCTTSRGGSAFRSTTRWASPSTP